MTIYILYSAYIFMSLRMLRIFYKGGVDWCEHIENNDSPKKEMFVHKVKDAESAEK